MRAAVYQPQYLPRLHYVNRALDADVFVVLDSAQFTRKLKHHGPDGATVHPSYQVHTPIRLASGRHLLTVPLRGGGARRPLDETLVADPAHWVPTHLRSLHAGYANAPRYGALAPGIAALLERDHPSLAALNLATLLWALAVLLRLDLGGDLSNRAGGGAAGGGRAGGGRDGDPAEHMLAAVNDRLAAQRRVPLRRIVRASDLRTARPAGLQQGNAWIAGLCHEVGADEYLCGGTAAGNYMDKEFFAERGITTVIQSWHCPTYSQRFATRQRFIPNLSILDLLLNVDPAGALDVVQPR
ncbi:MAG TPA: WbqC family protein [Euzebyales bacterium]|nr:WbqC family protein [Euzebyales bacterium]